MLSLATSPATPRQRSALIGIAGILCALWLIAAPFDERTWLGVDLGWALVVTQLMTAYLLFSQLFQQRSPAIALIAAAYLFTVIFYNLPIFWLSAKIVHPTSLLQSTRAHAWLGVFAHAGFPLFFLAYAVFDKYLEHIKLSVHKAIAVAIALFMAVFAFIILLGIFAISFESQLSTLFGLDGSRPFIDLGVSLTVFAIGLVSLIAFVVATRLQTLTHVWLALALLAAVLDIATIGLVHGARFTVGWTVAQLYGLIACAAIPLLYVFEFHWIYERLHVVAQVIRHQALVDELTGIGNKRQFDVVIDLEWRRAMRTGVPVSLVMVEVDRFAAYEEALGVAAGEEALRKVARALEKRLRRAGDIVARLDGDTFGLILADVNAGKAIEFARAIAAEIEHLGIVHPANPAKNIVTVSTAATTTVPALGRPVSEFIEAARASLQSIHPGMSA